MSFRRVGGEEAWKGRIFTVRRDSFEYDDGETGTREIAIHPGAVAMVVHDGEQLYLVAQPRESVDEQELLELPAGKLDEEGESPLEAAQRELAEEVGLAAASWEHLTTCYSSPGFTNEAIHIYLATDLREAEAGAEPDEHERITVRKFPLAELDRLIRDCRDAKTLVGLLWLKAMRD
jgi:8-oxo-dGTP pyrophosphatase MutT (NUDIX family)